jgi:glycosyltransferase involved in cell wall biosynthesis
MPHTNIRIIVEAAEMLARRYEPIKVILTAPLDWSSQSDPLMEAVRSKGLHWDVVSIDATLPAVYSALCQCAGITILPSPYERELSPVINDSLSLGTPVLLSDTPALRDALSADAAEHFAFDPLSPRDLADKIVSYLEDREAIVYRQRVLWPQQTESPSAIIARAEQVTEQALATHRATAGPHAPSPPGVAGLSPVKAIQVRKKLLSVVRPVSVWRAAMRALRRAGSISDARRGS